MRTSILALVVVVLGATSAPAPQSTPQTAADVFARVDQYWKAMDTYQVPVKINGSVKVSILSVPVAMDGTEYYKAPNRTTMRLNNVPSMAKSFSNTISNMGTPQTWEQTYDIVLNGTEQHGKHLAYVLVGTPKRAGANVKTVKMWVNTSSFAIQSVAFAYNNGSSLQLELSHHGLSPYHLPTSIALKASFPGYSGNATIVYGTYQINVAIPDSVFEQQ
jgi:outer membrane lipoprotein-sorting protein